MAAFEFISKAMIWVHHEFESLRFLLFPSKIMSALTQFLLRMPSRIDTLAKNGASVEQLLQDPDVLTAVANPGSDTLIAFLLSHIY